MFVTIGVNSDDLITSLFYVGGKLKRDRNMNLHWLANVLEFYM